METIYIFQPNFTDKPGLGIDSLVPAGEIVIDGLKEASKFILRLEVEGPVHYELDIDNGVNKLDDLLPREYVAEFWVGSELFETMQFAITRVGNERVFVHKEGQMVTLKLKVTSSVINIDTHEITSGVFNIKHENQFLRDESGSKDFLANQLYENVELIGWGEYKLSPSEYVRIDKQGKGANEIGGGTTIIIEPPDLHVARTL